MLRADQIQFEATQLNAMLNAKVHVSLINHIKDSKTLT